MNNTYRQIVIVSTIIVIVAVLYPMGLWFFLHVGLGLDWGIDRAYALWVGFVLLVSLVVGTVYLLGQDEKPKQMKRIP